MRYLTKSRFKLGLECPTKLFYTKKKKIYADSKIGDTFLEALAEGGYQVGELAKYLVSDDPYTEDITVETLDYTESLTQTQQKINAGPNCIIAEPAFAYKSLFIRVDLFEKIGNTINIYEVKSKSWGHGYNREQVNDVMITTPKRGIDKGKKTLNGHWYYYLYDLAFQKYVVEKSFPDCKVNAYLVLADKNKTTSVSGLNELFRINRKPNGTKEIKIKGNVTKDKLGNIPLCKLPMNDVCDFIYRANIDIDLEINNKSFESVIFELARIYENDERHWTTINKGCFDCQYNEKDFPNGLKSGFHECFKHQLNFTNNDFNKSMVNELWGGKSGAKSLVQEAIDEKMFFIKDLDSSDYAKEHDKAGLSPGNRRAIQIQKIKEKDDSFYIDKEGLQELFDSLEKPFHFIDFETSAVAIPFHKNRTPYEGIAFQYSYHILNKDGSIEHKNQFLSTDDSFPNYQFLESLMNDLDGKEGTIFRYHNHENSFLNTIYQQLLEEKDILVPNKEKLLAFVERIAKPNSNLSAMWKKGDYCMVDLYELVLSYYYPPNAKGSNSIKAILPAIINDSELIRNKYSKAIYGTLEMPSLNFNNHTWINGESSNNPYKSLDPVFEKFSLELDEELKSKGINIDSISDGGAAMMAYAFLQFSDISPREKQYLEKGLLKYCELDTMAMVMIMEAFMDWAK
ncbi:MAG: DUF2779 domain-containing protein [Flavobacteriales bacterium]|nr:DUF2779 domain-containing protein [Flavobacteriales bacterium]